MLINFSQGIIQKPNSPKLLKLSSDFNVELDSRSKNTIVSFADGDKHHLYTETEIKKKTWKIPRDKKTKWLFWELNKVDATINYGYTTVSPQDSIGNTFPLKPEKDLHFFNTSTNKMYVWTGQYWKDVLRVFAGKVSGDGILEELSTLPQNKIYKPVNAGHIIFDENDCPIKSGDSFVNTADIISTPLREHRPSVRTQEIFTSQPVPAFHAVTSIDNKSLLASNLQPAYPCIGLSIYGMSKNQKGRIITHGLIVNEDWDWSKDDKIVFVGENGELTSRVPHKLSFQKIGYVTGKNSIFVDISPLIKIYSQALLRLLNKTSFEDISDEDFLALQDIVESLYQFVEYDSIELTQPKDIWIL